MTKHVDIKQCKYSGNSIGFDRKGTFTMSNGFGRDCIILGANMTSSIMLMTKKDILILGEGPTQGLDNTILAAEKKYSINFTENNKKSCLSLHYNGANSFFFFVNGAKIIESKAKESEIVATLLNISKKFSVDNMKKTGLNELFMILVLIMILLQLMIY